MIKVSVIIPVYNQEKYLDGCLLSVTNQSLKDIEIICVNDGSTDKSLEILNYWKGKDNRIVLVTGPNGGYGRAMNKGLEIAKGEYIGIVEPDDFIDLKMYEILYEGAKKNDLDICKGDFYRYYEDDFNNKRYEYGSLSGNLDDYNVVFDPKKYKKSFDFYMITCCGIYKKLLIDSKKVRYNETPGASYQDNGFYFRTFSNASKIMLINYPVYIYRCDNPNSSINQKDKVYAADKEFDFIKNNLENDDLWEEYKYQYIKLRILTSFYTIDRIGEKYREEYAQNLKLYIENTIKNKELDWDIFYDSEKQRINKILISPKLYVEQKDHVIIDIKDEQLRNMEQKVEDISNSISYRLGLCMTYLPRKFYHLIKGV